jgi:hypothetical protein
MVVLYPINKEIQMVRAIFTIAAYILIIAVIMVYLEDMLLQKPMVMRA